MEKIMEGFGIDPKLLIAQIVNFFILLLILKKFAYGPILKILEKRKETIAESLKNAEEIEKRLQKTEEDREKKLDQASKEARELIEEATKQAQQIVQDSHSKAQMDMEEIMKKGQASISQEREKMQQEIRSELADMVVLALEKVTSKALDKKDQKRLLDDAIKNL